MARERRRSIDRFLAQRSQVDPAGWIGLNDELGPAVEAVLAATGDLREITAEALIGLPPDGWHILRYCCGPPVSEEDLWTYVDGPKFKSVKPHFARRLAEVFSKLVDPVRFGWVRERRRPTAGERARAVNMTVMLLASQRFATSERGEASRRQEEAVAKLLLDIDFKEATNVQEIAVIDELPRGMFSPERKVAGSKCDIPVRLQDGRLLALECKASNGPKNGWKRLAREVGGKASTWRAAFGNQVVTGAIISGVFDLSLLEAQQKAGVVIFWEHDLAPLADFVARAH